MLYILLFLAVLFGEIQAGGCCSKPSSSARTSRNAGRLGQLDQQTLQFIRAHLLNGPSGINPPNGGSVSSNGPEREHLYTRLEIINGVLATIFTTRAWGNLSKANQRNIRQLVKAHVNVADRNAKRDGRDKLTVAEGQGIYRAILRDMQNMNTNANLPAIESLGELPELSNQLQ